MIAYLVSNGDDCRLTSLLPHPAISEHRWSPTGYARLFTALLKVHDQAVRCITTSGYHNFKLDRWRQFMSIYFTLRESSTLHLYPGSMNYMVHGGSAFSFGSCGNIKVIGAPGAAYAFPLSTQVNLSSNLRSQRLPEVLCSWVFSSCCLCLPFILNLRSLSRMRYASSTSLHPRVQARIPSRSAPTVSSLHFSVLRRVHCLRPLLCDLDAVT
jgi:UDP-2,3-diacylglucosamine pyrophosphatase LpxH